MTALPPPNPADRRPDMAPFAHQVLIADKQGTGTMAAPTWVYDDDRHVRVVVRALIVMAFALGILLGFLASSAFAKESTPPTGTTAVTVTVATTAPGTRTSESARPIGMAPGAGLPTEGNGRLIGLGFGLLGLSVVLIALARRQPEEATS